MDDRLEVQFLRLIFYFLMQSEEKDIPTKKVVVKPPVPPVIQQDHGSLIVFGQIFGGVVLISGVLLFLQSHLFRHHLKQVPSPMVSEETTMSRERPQKNFVDGKLKNQMLRNEETSAFFSAQEISNMTTFFEDSTVTGSAFPLHKAEDLAQRKRDSPTEVTSQTWMSVVNNKKQIRDSRENMQQPSLFSKVGNKKQKRNKIDGQKKEVMNKSVQVSNSGIVFEDDKPHFPVMVLDDNQRSLSNTFLPNDLRSPLIRVMADDHRPLSKIVLSCGHRSSPETILSCDQRSSSKTSSTDDNPFPDGDYFKPFSKTILEGDSRPFAKSFFASDHLSFPQTFLPGDYRPSYKLMSESDRRQCSKTVFRDIQRSSFINRGLRFDPRPFPKIELGGDHKLSPNSVSREGQQQEEYSEYSIISKPLDKNYTPLFFYDGNRGKFTYKNIDNRNEKPMYEKSEIKLTTESLERASHPMENGSVICKPGVHKKALESITEDKFLVLSRLGDPLVGHCPLQDELNTANSLCCQICQMDKGLIDVGSTKHLCHRSEKDKLYTWLIPDCKKMTAEPEMRDRIPNKKGNDYLADKNKSKRCLFQTPNAEICQLSQREITKIKTTNLDSIVHETFMENHPTRRNKMSNIRRTRETTQNLNLLHSELDIIRAEIDDECWSGGRNSNKAIINAPKMSWPVVNGKSWSAVHIVPKQPNISLESFLEKKESKLLLEKKVEIALPDKVSQEATIESNVKTNETELNSDKLLLKGIDVSANVDGYKATYWDEHQSSENIFSLIEESSTSDVNLCDGKTKHEETETEGEEIMSCLSETVMHRHEQDEPPRLDSELVPGNGVLSSLPILVEYDHHVSLSAYSHKMEFEREKRDMKLEEVDGSSRIPHLFEKEMKFEYPSKVDQKSGNLTSNTLCQKRNLGDNYKLDKHPKFMKITKNMVEHPIEHTYLPNFVESKDDMMTSNLFHSSKNVTKNQEQALQLSSTVLLREISVESHDIGDQHNGEKKDKLVREHIREGVTQGHGDKKNLRGGRHHRLVRDSETVSRLRKETIARRNKKDSLPTIEKKEQIEPPMLKKNIKSNVAKLTSSKEKRTQKLDGKRNDTKEKIIQLPHCKSYVTGHNPIQEDEDTDQNGMTYIPLKNMDEKISDEATVKPRGSLVKWSETPPSARFVREGSSSSDESPVSPKKRAVPTRFKKKNIERPRISGSKSPLSVQTDKAPVNSKPKSDRFQLSLMKNHSPEKVIEKSGGDKVSFESLRTRKPYQKFKKSENKKNVLLPGYGSKIKCANTNSSEIDKEISRNQASLPPVMKGKKGRQQIEKNQNSDTACRTEQMSNCRHFLEGIKDDESSGLFSFDSPSTRRVSFSDDFSPPFAGNFKWPSYHHDKKIRQNARTLTHMIGPVDSDKILLKSNSNNIVGKLFKSTVNVGGGNEIKTGRSMKSDVTEKEIQPTANKNSKFLPHKKSPVRLKRLLDTSRIREADSSNIETGATNNRNLFSQNGEKSKTGNVDKASAMTKRSRPNNVFRKRLRFEKNYVDEKTYTKSQYVDTLVEEKAEETEDKNHSKEVKLKKIVLPHHLDVEAETGTEKVKDALVCPEVKEETKADVPPLITDTNKTLITSPICLNDDVITKCMKDKEEPHSKIVEEMTTCEVDGSKDSRSQDEALQSQKQTYQQHERGNDNESQRENTDKGDVLIGTNQGDKQELVANTSEPVHKDIVTNTNQLAHKEMLANTSEQAHKDTLVQTTQKTDKEVLTYSLVDETSKADTEMLIQMTEKAEIKMNDLAGTNQKDKVKMSSQKKDKKLFIHSNQGVNNETLETKTQKAGNDRLKNTIQKADNEILVNAIQKADNENLVNAIQKADNENLVNAIQKADNENLVNAIQKADNENLVNAIQKADNENLVNAIQKADNEILVIADKNKQLFESITQRADNDEFSKTDQKKNGDISARINQKTDIEVSSKDPAVDNESLVDVTHEESKESASDTVKRKHKDALQSINHPGYKDIFRDKKQRKAQELLADKKKVERSDASINATQVEYRNDLVGKNADVLTKTLDARERDFGQSVYEHEAQSLKSCPSGKDPENYNTQNQVQDCTLGRQNVNNIIVDQCVSAGENVLLTSVEHRENSDQLNDVVNHTDEKLMCDVKETVYRCLDVDEESTNDNKDGDELVYTCHRDEKMIEALHSEDQMPLMEISHEQIYESLPETWNDNEPCIPKSRPCTDARETFQDNVQHRIPQKEDKVMSSEAATLRPNDSLTLSHVELIGESMLETMAEMSGPDVYEGKPHTMTNALELEEVGKGDDHTAQSLSDQKKYSLDDKDEPFISVNENTKEDRFPLLDTTHEKKNDLSQIFTENESQAAITQSLSKSPTEDEAKDQNNDNIDSKTNGELSKGQQDCPRNDQKGAGGNEHKSGETTNANLNGQNSVNSKDQDDLESLLLSEICASNEPGKHRIKNFFSENRSKRTPRKRLQEPNAWNQHFRNVTSEERDVTVGDWKLKTSSDDIKRTKTCNESPNKQTPPASKGKQLNQATPNPMSRLPTRLERDHLNKKKKRSSKSSSVSSPQCSGSHTANSGRLKSPSSYYEHHFGGKNKKPNSNKAVTKQKRQSTFSEFPSSSQRLSTNDADLPSVALQDSQTAQCAPDQKTDLKTEEKTPNQSTKEHGCRTKKRRCSRATLEEFLKISECVNNSKNISGNEMNNHNHTTYSNPETNNTPVVTYGNPKTMPVRRKPRMTAREKGTEDFTLELSVKTDQDYPSDKGSSDKRNVNSERIKGHQLIDGESKETSSRVPSSISIAQHSRFVPVTEERGLVLGNNKNLRESKRNFLCSPSRSKSSTKRSVKSNSKLSVVSSEINLSWANSAVESSAVTWFTDSVMDGNDNNMVQNQYEKIDFEESIYLESSSDISESGLLDDFHKGREKNSKFHYIPDHSFIQSSYTGDDLKAFLTDDTYGETRLLGVPLDTENQRYKRDMHCGISSERRTKQHQDGRGKASPSITNNSSLFDVFGGVKYNKNRRAINITSTQESSKAKSNESYVLSAWTRENGKQFGTLPGDKINKNQHSNRSLCSSTNSQIFDGTEEKANELTTSLLSWSQQHEADELARWQTGSSRLHRNKRRQCHSEFDVLEMRRSRHTIHKGVFSFDTDDGGNMMCGRGHQSNVCSISESEHDRSEGTHRTYSILGIQRDRTHDPMDGSVGGYGDGSKSSDLDLDWYKPQARPVMITSDHNMSAMSHNQNNDRFAYRDPERFNDGHQMSISLDRDFTLTTTSQPSIVTHRPEADTVGSQEHTINGQTAASVTILVKLFENKSDP